MNYQTINDYLLKMTWLDALVHIILKLINIENNIIQFFIYDTIKISILLITLIFIVSYIQSYFPPEKTKRILSRFKGLSANIISALLGTVTPFCSCSSIPLFIGFTSAGIPIGATFSFLISSPMVDLASVVLLTSIFGYKVASIYVITGLIIAIIGGLIIEKMNMQKYIEEYITQIRRIDRQEQKLNLKQRLKYAKNQVKETIIKVFPYIVVGVLIGSFIHNVIPEEFVIKILGEKNPSGVILATLIGIPMYGDIFGTIPIAEALLSKGANLGTVLSFMMAVTTLSLPSMIMLKKAIKPKLLGLFILICFIGIIAVGYLFNIMEVFII